MTSAKAPLRAKKGFIFIICGTSGSGKTTLAREILKQPQFKGRFTKSVSFTTRPKRPGERDGRDYVFISAKEFKRLLLGKKILEYTRYLGYYYGTSYAILKQALDKGLNAVLCLDIKGALFIKRRYPERTIAIFIKPPSLSVLKKRILGRWAGTNRKELAQRLRLAEKELTYAKKYDYCLVNDNLKKAVEEINNIIRWVISH